MLKVFFFDHNLSFTDVRLFLERKYDSKYCIECVLVVVSAKLEFMIEQNIDIFSSIVRTE